MVVTSIVYIHLLLECLGIGTAVHAAVQVSDFGLSQVLPDNNQTQLSTKYSGTVTHMAPELIEDGKVYPQGDVYAFGVIMWEVFTGGAPYPNMAHPQIMVRGAGGWGGLLVQCSCTSTKTHGLG